MQVRGETWVSYTEREREVMFYNWSSPMTRSDCVFLTDPRFEYIVSRTETVPVYNITGWQNPQKVTMKY